MYSITAIGVKTCCCLLLLEDAKQIQVFQSLGVGLRVMKLKKQLGLSIWNNLQKLAWSLGCSHLSDFS